METKSRTIAKTVTWRFLATLITMSVAWGFSGSTSVALSVGLADTTIKLFIFYGHERMWTRIRFGYSHSDPAKARSPAGSGNEVAGTRASVSSPRMHQSLRFSRVRKHGTAHLAWQRSASSKEFTPETFNAS
jgi:uncharacterized membrane protein